MFGLKIPFFGEEKKEETTAQSTEEEKKDTRTPEQIRADEERLEKRKREQALAYQSRKTPAAGLRRFEMIIQNIVVTNSDEKNHDVFVKFVLGRTRKQEMVKYAASFGFVFLIEFVVASEKLLGKRGL